MTFDTTSYEYIRNGSIINATKYELAEKVGTWWPGLLGVIILFVIWIATDSPEIRGFSSVLLIAVMGLLQVTQVVFFHPVIYGIAVSSMTISLYKMFWKGDRQ